MKKIIAVLVLAAGIGGGVAIAEMRKQQNDAGCGRVGAACKTSDDCCESFACNNGTCQLKGGAPQ